MGRAEQRLFTVGRFWLAERGQSPFYQIRWYDEATKTTRGKSTRCRALDDAKQAILAHAAADLAEGPQAIDDALVAGAFMLFWKEHGRTRINAATVASSLRIFLAFMDQDKVGFGAKVADLKPDVFRRFSAWRQKPHSYEIEWLGEMFVHSSPGVSGEAIQRNLDDVRAALNHAVAEGRIPYAPKVPSVASGLRSPPRDVRLTIDQLGAIVGYAAYDLPALRWVLGMLATGCRPDAVLKWNVAEQWDGGPIFDTHPAGAPRTKKRNAVVPLIEEFRPWLKAWAEHPHKRVASRKTWWRTMRGALGLPANIVPKTIRHTVATELRARGVTLADLAGLLGHTSENRITQVYAKYDPARLSAAKQELSALWRDACASANDWLTNHFRCTTENGETIVVANEAQNG
jgi:integrase